MSTPNPSRSPKRERKKQAAAARRAAMLAELERKRKRRTRLLVSTIGALVVVGGGLALLGGGVLTKSKPTPKPEKSPALAPSPAPIACDAKLPREAGSVKPKLSAVEDQKLDKKKTYLWRLDTSCGRIDVKLALDKAPKTVNSIAFLTRKGYYDGLTFHRLVKNFVIQGGDPLGTGMGGPDYKVTEAPPKSQKYTRGVVAMAKSGAESAGTSGSQFFIVVGDQASSLTADYAIVGEVVDGMDVADKIVGFAGSPSQENPEGSPTSKVYIDTAKIVEQ